MTLKTQENTFFIFQTDPTALKLSMKQKDLSKIGFKIVVKYSIVKFVIV